MRKPMNKIKTPHFYFKAIGFKSAKLVQFGNVELVKGHNQEDYGEKNDCTIISIATLIEYLIERTEDFEIIYKTVVANINPKWLYSGDVYGTIPLFINCILNRNLQYFGLEEFKSKHNYIKSLGYDNQNIIKLLDNGVPVIINLSGNNKDYYKNHTVLIIGYLIYKDQYGAKKILMKVYDNWSSKVRYLDYNCIPKISSINYITKSNK
ncbi:C39 family peptidase [Vallitalea okinawensis]|uniref:C39 family peptidase n=1 Tax=Vallitalea okinawensis TaxID=2078660 RepID=UPI000CFB18B3|nr:C39 family peptidase [Vallitalea okinawensis]